MKQAIVTMIAICMFGANAFAGVSPKSKLEVIDANKNKVGDVFQVDGFTKKVFVLFHESPETFGSFYLMFNRDEVISDDDLWYTGHECSGSAYILEQDASFIYHPVAIDASGDVYIGTRDHGPIPIEFASRYNQGDKECQETGLGQNNTVHEAITAIPVMNVNKFKPPFHIRAK